MIFDLEFISNYLKLCKQNMMTPKCYIHGKLWPGSVTASFAFDLNGPQTPF